MANEMTPLNAEINALRTEVRELRAMVLAMQGAPAARMAFDAPGARVTILQRTAPTTYAAALATPRTVIGFTTTNSTTGRTVACDRFSLTQLERGAYKFARMQVIKRAPPYWRGDRALFGIMRDLFEQRGAIIRHHGQSWSWAIDPPDRRTVAAQIVATIAPPRRTQ
jgi:hypothetical protein